MGSQRYCVVEPIALALDHRARGSLVVVRIRIGPIVIRIESIVAIRPLLVFAITPRPIIPIVWRLVVATRVDGWLNGRATWPAELLTISLQASHNPVHIGHLRAA